MYCVPLEEARDKQYQIPSLHARCPDHNFAFAASSVGSSMSLMSPAASLR